MYYPISQDAQVQEYNQMRKRYLASEADRKHKQMLLRRETGLPDVEGKLRVIAEDVTFVNLHIRVQTTEVFFRGFWE